MKFLRFLTKRFFITVNLVTAVLFLLACLVPYVSPSYCWPISFLGLAFPFILAAMVFFLIFWLIFDVKCVLLPAIALIIGWRSVFVLIAFNGPVDPPAEKPPGSMTVLSYNVRYFKDFTNSAGENRRLRSRILDLIKMQQPDIACLQEFYTSENPHDFNNREYISQTMNLPYRYFSSDHNYGNNHSGSIIFSRYPIVHAQKVKLLESGSSESVVYADIVRGADTIRVFTLHLQSVYLNRRDLAVLEQVKVQQDTALAASRTILSKLRKAFVKRQQQSETVAAEIAKSPYPVILCGDFNDTPNSYAYFKIRGHLQDAFLEKGWGIGPTYAGISPTLRIDYILVDPSYRVNYFYRIPHELSDHYPVVSNITTSAADTAGVLLPRADRQAP